MLAVQTKGYGETMGTAFTILAPIQALEIVRSALNVRLQQFAESSAIVISEVREDTDPNTYAIKLKIQVDGLISKGVPAKNISVTGELLHLFWRKPPR